MDNLNSEYVSKSVKGSPYWMSPEVINKSGHSKQADIWSLGCCVIEMLTGKPPWSQYGKDAKKIMNIIEVSGTPPPYPEGISTVCKEFLDMCFIRDWRGRPLAKEFLDFHPFVKGKVMLSLLVSRSFELEQ